MENIENVVDEKAKVVKAKTPIILSYLFEDISRAEEALGQSFASFQQQGGLTFKATAAFIWFGSEKKREVFTFQGAFDYVQSLINGGNTMNDIALELNAALKTSGLMGE